MRCVVLHPEIATGPLGLLENCRHDLDESGIASRRMLYELTVIFSPFAPCEIETRVTSLALLPLPFGAALFCYS